MDYYIKNYKIISLGYNCFPKKYTIEIGISQETNLFDYIGTPMWSINKLFENNFVDFLNINEFENIQVFTNQKMITNKKYNIKFPHDFPHITKKSNIVIHVPFKNKDYLKFKFKFIKNNKFNISKYFDTFKNIYERRINRIKNILSNETKILFIRFEESQKNRIIYNSYKDNLKKLELEYLIDYSNIIKKAYPNLKFKIIYISSIFDINYIKENNIIILKLDEEDIDWNNCGNKFKVMFDKYKSFIEENID
jgi:hypothetical protein